MKAAPQIFLANPRGFCAGVDRAIAIVEEALARFGSPIYVRHEVVHNRVVVNRLKSQGVVFVEELADVPAGNTVIFSAHGVSQSVRAEAGRLGLRVFDATCPLVIKVHHEVQRLHRSGYEIVMIGHKDHPEVEGTMGQVSSGMYLVETLNDVAALQVRSPEKLAYITQTTLSVDDARYMVEALQVRFPQICAPRSESICYATQNRQDAVRSMLGYCEVVIVVGSPNSSNSTRLCELARSHQIPAYLVDAVDQIQPGWIKGADSIGITAGASAPETLVQDILCRLRELGAADIQELPGVVERVEFALPKELIA